ncbi:transposase [Klebsiella michiganensis]|uniref:transposase n=1 Tax=Klebsiella michiganensis TaxID=1134687 RepID=UPI003EBF0523
MSGKRYPEEFKIEAVKQVIDRGHSVSSVATRLDITMKWFTEFGHLNRGDMLTSEQHRCHNEKKKFQRRV